jgi:hypothetical protein
VRVSDLVKTKVILSCGRSPDNSFSFPPMLLVFGTCIVSHPHHSALLSVDLLFSAR